MEEVKIFAGGGMDSDSAIEYIDRADYLSAFNIRNVGTDKQEGGYITSLEGTVLINFTLPVGLNKCIGVKAFEQLRKAYIFIYNSSGKHTVTEYNFDTNAVTKVFQNLTDTGAVDILPLDPKFYVIDIDYIGEELYFLPSSRVPTKFNIGRLKSGYYEVVQAQDISVIKAKPDSIPTTVYTDSPAKNSNPLEGNIIKFSLQYIYNNKEESVFGELSKANVPSVQDKGQIGKNNTLIVSVDAGNSRVETVVIAAKFGNNLQWKEVKRVERSRIVILPASINIGAGILESYNSGIYSFVFYNDGLYLALDELTTDLEYDRVPKEAQSQTSLDGNILNYSNITEGYNPVGIAISCDIGYKRLIEPIADTSDYLAFVRHEWMQNPSTILSNIVLFVFTGNIRTNDVITIRLRNRTTGEIVTYSYTGKAQFDGNTLESLRDFGVREAFNGFVVTQAIDTTGDTIYKLKFNGSSLLYPYSGDVFLISSTVENFKAYSALKLNSSRQFGIMYEYEGGRLGGVLTNDELIANTNSYSKTNGFSPTITLNINHTPPSEAIGYHIVSSGQLTHLNTLYACGKLIKPTGYASGSYNFGDYVLFDATVYRSVFNGVNTASPTDEAKWSKINSLSDVITGNYLALDLTSLKKFGDSNSSSIIDYDYTKGDRVNLCYYTSDTDEDIYFTNNPIDVGVTGLDIDIIGGDKRDRATGYILKIQKGDLTDALQVTLADKDILLEIYTPKKVTDSTNLFYSIGERYSITNGVHDQTRVEINRGECYYKTRAYYRPTDLENIKVFLVEDFNYNDFVEGTDVTDLGRGYLYNKEDKEKTLPAHMRYSDIFNASTGINLLNRFFSESMYGNSAGQSTDIHGGIKRTIQRGSTLIVFQELEIGYIPVNTTIYEDATGQQNVAVSTKLLNNIRYSGNGVGIGNAPESFAERDGVHYFVDPNKSEPYLEAGGTVRSIAGKMSKFFRDNLQNVTTTGRKIIGRYNNFYDEYELTVEAVSGVITQTTFSTGNFTGDAYMANTGEITVTQPINGTVVYNNITGIATYTPDNDIIGADTFTFEFQEIPRNVCLTVLVGDKIPNAFFFLDLVDKTLSTLLESNSILVDGINIPSPISITGGEYRINGIGAWLTAPSTVVAGDTVKVRQTSSASQGTTTNCTLTIGGISDTFSISTFVLSEQLWDWSFENTTPPAPYGTFVIEINDAPFLSIGGANPTNDTNSFGFNSNDKIKITVHVEADSAGYSATELSTDIAKDAGYTDIISEYINVTNTSFGAQEYVFEKLATDIWNFNVFSRSTVAAFPN